LAGDQLRQQAFVVRIEVLHQDESHAAVRWHAGEERLERGQAARRGADADDQRGVAGLGRRVCG